MSEYIKTAIKTGLSGLGLRVMRMKNVPVGVDICLDLRRCVPHRRINTIFDVGANTGQTARAFARYFPGARIFSFEPVEATCRQLAANTSSLPNVRCIHSALGATEEIRRLFHQKNSEWNSLAEGVNQATESGAYENVAVTSLDDFCSREGIRGIDLLKTDTEGFDLEVLRGAQRTLEGGRVLFIYSEVTFEKSDYKHTNFFQLAEFLKDFNFRFVSLYDQITNRNLTGSAYSNALFSNPEAL